jgi:hypothetical protein
MRAMFRFLGNLIFGAFIFFFVFFASLLKDK